MKYDYIVIGAGVRGRNSRHQALRRPRHLGAPAGGRPRTTSDIDSLPEEVKYGYMSTKSVWDSDHNWQYRARATDTAEIEIPRGKVTGGSSAINGQIFLRGIPEDYDGWG